MGVGEYKYTNTKYKNVHTYKNRNSKKIYTQNIEKFGWSEWDIDTSGSELELGDH